MGGSYIDENGLAHRGDEPSIVSNTTSAQSNNDGSYIDENGLAHRGNGSVPSQSYYTDTLPGAPDTGGTDSNKLPLDFVSQQPTVQPYWEPDKIVERYDWYRANPDKEPEIVGPTKQETEAAYTYLANTKFKNVPRNDWEMTDYDTDPYYQSVISNWKDPREPQTKEAAATISQAEELMKPKEMQGTYQDLNTVGKAATLFIPTGTVTEGAPAISKFTQSIIPAIGSYMPGYLAAGGAAATTAAIIAATGGTAAIPIAAIANIGGIGTALLQAVNYITGKEIPILNKVGNWLDIIGQSAEKALVGMPSAIKAMHPEIDSNTEWGYKNPRLEARGFEKKPTLIGDAVDNLFDMSAEIIKLPFGNSAIQKGELKKAWNVGAIGLEENPFIANTALNIANKILGNETADYGEYYRYELGTNEPQKAALQSDEMYLTLMKAVDVYSKMVNPETGKPYTGREIEDNILLRVATNQYGISGALNDIIGQELLDPTNYAGNIQNSVVNTYAKITGNQPLQTATEINAGESIAPFPINALSSKQKTGGLTELAEIHKKVLRGELGENAVKVDTLTESQRNKAGLTPEGKYRELQPAQPTQATGFIGKITNAIQNLTNLTPVAKAAELSKMALDMTSAVILMSDGNPETIRTNVLKLADMMEVSPDDAVSKIYGTAEQRTVTDALKAIATSPKFDGIVNQLKATESMRMNLSLLSSQIGKNPKEIIQGIIDNPQSIKRLIQEAAAKNNGSIMGQMLTDDGTLIIDQFQVFTDKKNPLPYTVEQVASEYNKLFANTLSDYVTELYDVKPDNVAIRISDMMKKFQSLLLLSLNPAYLANNFTNDIVTRAATGVFGFPNINDWVENEMGIAPARMYDSMQEFRGAENTVTGSYSIVNEKSKNAKRKGDKVDKISDLFSKVNSVMPGTKINGKIEGVESARANVVGQMQYMHKFWIAGKGFDELPVELKQRIDSVIPNGSWLLYSGIQSGYNFDKIIKNLFGEYVKPDLGSLLESIVQDKFPIDSEIVNELFAKTGKLSELQTLLDNTNTPEERAAVIESIRNRSKDIVKMYSDNQIISEAENVRNDIALSGDKNQYRQQAMKYISYVSVTREDQWLRSRESYRDAYAKKVHDSLTQGEWNSYIASIAARNRSEWNAFNAREKQVYAGIIRALGFSDEISAEYISLVMDYQSNWDDFYKYQQQKINEYYDGAITWEDYEADTDKAYDEHFQTEMLVQEKLNESFLRGYSASGFDVAPIRELQNRIITIRHEMHDMQVDIRQRTRAAAKSLAREDADKIKNEMYLAFEPEYNGKIEEIYNLQSQIGAEVGRDPVEKAREQIGRPIESVSTSQTPADNLDNAVQKMKAQVILNDADVIRSNAQTDYDNAIHETEADRQAKAERPEYYTRDKIRQSFIDSGFAEDAVDLYMELFDAREKQWNKQFPGKDMYKEALRVINITKDEMQGDPLLSQVEVLSPADINTDKFRNWFGDSKVVDADGKPLVVYHGSPYNFDVFSYDKMGTNGTSEGYGFYFSDSKDIAEGYSRGQGNKYESYVKITKPLSNDGKSLTKNDLRKLIINIDKMDIEGEESAHWFLSDFNDVNRYGINKVVNEAVNLLYENNSNDVDLISEMINVSGSAEKVYRALKNTLGYDGIITKWEANDVRGEVNIYIPFLPEQIKSINNTGSWDPNNPNMLYQSLNERIKGTFHVVDGDTAIHFLESKDVTTLVHESGHLFRRTLNDKQLDDFAQWAGFKSADEYLDYDNRFWDGKLTEEESKRYSEAEEKFARGWEQYLIEGKAPTPTLTKVFKAFTEWMLDIYKAVKSALTSKDYSGQKEFIFNGKPLDIKAEINGVRLVDIFDSMLATKETRGSTTTANGIIDPTMRYEFQYKIMDLSDIKPSHQWSGDKLIDNSMYDKALQPRAREQQQSVMQINNMASELSPDLLLLEYHSLDRGAPIIGDDNNIESGNGRMLALLRAKERYPERWAEYQQALLSEINNYGINPEALSEFRNPVLVRERITDIDRTDFAREANKPVALQMTAQENAVNDSKLISDVALSNLDILDNETIEGAIDARRNSGFVQSFMSRLSDNEAAQYYFKNKDGNLVLNEQGRRRIVNALFAKVYGQAGDSLLQSFTMSTESNIKLLEAALKDSLPQMAVIEGMIARGIRSPEYSIANDIAIAGEKLTRLRRTGMNVSDYLNQISLPGLEEELTPAQRMFLQYFSEQRSAKKMRQFIREYANLIRNMPDSGQDALFYLPPVSKEELITRAFEKIGDDKSPMLFQTDWLASAIAQFDAGNPITLEQLKQIATPDYQNTELTPDENIIPDIDEYTTDEIYAKKINPIMHGEYMIAARVYKDGFPIAYYPYNLRMKEIPYNGKVYDVLGIDIDNADQYLFWDGEQIITIDTKQDLADLDIMDDMPTIPQGKQESFLTMPAGEAYEELVSKYLDPILDELHDRYEAELTRNKMAGSFSQLDNDSKVALYKYMNGVKDSLAATKYNALKFGEMKRDQALLNYNKRYGFDTYLTVISPYQFWYTRSMLNWAKRMIDKPVWFTTYARLKEKEELFARDENPTRLSGTTKFPMPYLEDWMGGALYIDTMSQFFPFAQFLNKAESYSQDKNFLNKKVESLLKEQLDEGMIKSQDYLEALRTKNTPAWNDAYAIISENYSKDPSLGGLAQQYMQLPFLLTWAINKAKGKEGEIGNLPITRTGLSLQTLTKGIPVLETAGNIVGGAMTLPEQGLRKLFNLDYNELGNYGDYSIRKQLSQMGNSGEISREEMLDAQRTFSGPAYEEAYRRQREELMLKTQGAAAIDAMKAFIQGDAKITDVLQALFVAPFGGSVYPEDEYQLRQKQDELEQAYDDQASGKRPKAVSEFFDANPTFIGRKASFIDDPEELNKYIAYQNITNAYYNLPKAQQLAVQQSLGTDFYNAVINKETRNYKSTSYDDLLTWEYAMRGDIPNLPASEINKAKQNAPKITYYTQPVVDAVDTFNNMVKQNFPANIGELEKYYYSLPKQDQYDYLRLHPELDQYIQFKYQYKQNNEAYQVYKEDQSNFLNNVMAQRCFSEMAESVRNDLEYSKVTGKQLRGASINQLKYLYQKYDNFNSFDKFVEILKVYE